MTQRLFVTDLHSVGLVQYGDDPEAQVAIYKSATMENSEHTDDVSSEPQESVLDNDETVVQNDDVSKADEIIKSQAQELAKLNEEVAALREEAAVAKAARLDLEADDFAKAYERLGDSEEWAAIYKEAPTGLLDRLIPLLNALNERIEMSELFKEVGGGASEPADPIEKRDQFVKDHPEMSQAEARAQFWRENPDLREEARNL